MFVVVLLKEKLIVAANQATCGTAAGDVVSMSTDLSVFL